jgi:ubiquinone/menaquinone biosynthesis C-methylase UbiE
MRTRISPENPHGLNRYGFAWECVPGGGSAHLDVGCHDGDFLASLQGKRITRLVGVDISRDAIRLGRERYPHLELIHLADTALLPFRSATFSSISLIEVLEHVHEQSALLGELNRVLDNDGRLIVSVPGRHVLSVLDLGNFKFRFPLLHRWYYCRTHTAAEYEYRFVSNPDGLVGDISAQKRWHQHFSRSELRSLLHRSGFQVETFDGTGLCRRLITALNYPLQRFGLVRAVVRWAAYYDSLWFESENLFCACRKEHRRPRPAAQVERSAEVSALGERR